MEASGGHPQPWQTRYAHACAWDQTFPPLAMTDLFLAHAAAHPDAPLVDFYGRIYSYAAMLAEARRFAAGLRGMAASSPRYLARQFLNGDGAVLLKPRQVEVRLRRVPLHVLLRMAGAVGDLGPMACLGGRRLVLHLEET